MGVSIKRNNDLEYEDYVQENLKLLKKIQILEAENNQLLSEFHKYKRAYEKWACNKYVIILKKILRKV